MIKQFGDAAISLIGRTFKSEQARGDAIVGSSLLFTTSVTIASGLGVMETGIPQQICGPGMTYLPLMIAGVAGAGVCEAMERPMMQWSARAFRQLLP